MHIVLVHVHVKPESIEQFIEATMDNARNSNQEAGVIRFDFLQQVEDPSKFTLIEIYNASGDQLAHRESEHYLCWRDAVGDMMAEPRKGIRYHSLYPDEGDQ